jgi:hypothetical protein
MPNLILAKLVLFKTCTAKGERSSLMKYNLYIGRRVQAIWKRDPKKYLDPEGMRVGSGGSFIMGNLIS